MKMWSKLEAQNRQISNFWPLKTCWLCNFRKDCLDLIVCMSKTVYRIQCSQVGNTDFSIRNALQCSYYQQFNKCRCVVFSFELCKEMCYFLYSYAFRTFTKRKFRMLCLVFLSARAFSEERLLICVFLFFVVVVFSHFAKLVFWQSRIASLTNDHW